MFKVFVCILLILQLPCFLYSEGVYEPNPEYINQKLEYYNSLLVRKEAEEFSQTVFARSFTDPIIEGKNVIYFTSYTILFNTFNTRFPDIQALAGTLPEWLVNANYISDYLNDIPKEYYRTYADIATEKKIKRLNRRLKFVFPEADIYHVIDRSSVLDTENRTIFAYGYFQVNIPFNPVLEGDYVMQFNNQENEVQAFGDEIEYYFTGNSITGEQVIVEYLDMDEDIIIVQLIAQDENVSNEIVIAQIKPCNTLWETYDYVNELRSNELVNIDFDYIFEYYGIDVEIDELDFLISIPKIQFQVHDDFTDVQGIIVRVNNPDMIGDLDVNFESLFQLNELGLRMISEGGMFVEEGIPLYWPIEFNKPFFIFVQRKGASYPYFAAWIANTELMLPYDPDIKIDRYLSPGDDN